MRIYSAACADCLVLCCVAVHIVLVTDLVVLLTERDQKYNLPAILDLKVSTVHCTHTLHTHTATHSHTIDCLQCVCVCIMRRKLVS